MENDFSIRFRSLLGGRTDAISFLLVSLFFLLIFFFYVFRVLLCVSSSLLSRFEIDLRRKRKAIFLLNSIRFCVSFSSFFSVLSRSE